MERFLEAHKVAAFIMRPDLDLIGAVASLEELPVAVDELREPLSIHCKTS